MRSLTESAESDAARFLFNMRLSLPLDLEKSRNSFGIGFLSFSADGMLFSFL